MVIIATNKDSEMKQQIIQTLKSENIYLTSTILIENNTIHDFKNNFDVFNFFPRNQVFLCALVEA